MSAMISVRKPVHWYEGMLLSPQHFQQNNLYMEQQMLHMMQRMSPFYFGMLALTFDLPAMAEADYKTVRVKHLHAILKDGTEVRYHEADHIRDDDTSDLLELELSQTDDIKPMEPFYVYVAVAKTDDAHGHNTSLRRYNFVKSASVRDIYDSANKVELDNLEPHVQLLEKAALSPSYSYLPIIKLRKKYDGAFEVLDYTPPCLRVTSTPAQTPAHSDLWQRVEEKLALLRSKANERREYVSKGNSEALLAFKDKQELVQIGQCLPGLQIMMNTQRCHPYDLYLALVNMTASLAAFRSDGELSEYKNYRHDQLDEIFAVPLQDLEAVIKQIEQPFETRNFALDLDNQYTYKFEQPVTAKHLMLSFRTATGVSRDQLQQWVEDACIYSLDKQQRVYFNRLTGITRSHVNNFTELDMSEEPEELFYLLDLDHEDFTRGDANTPQSTLMIVGTDQKLDPYAPLAIQWFKPRE